MKNNYLYAFEKLTVWHDARKFVKEVYLMTSEFPEKEKYGLCSQMQRASISVVSNLVEGASRNSVKEQLRFYEIAYGSLMEVYCQTIIASDLEYIKIDKIHELKLHIDKIANKLNALSRSIKRGC